jgi:hypothetical protein
LDYRCPPACRLEACDPKRAVAIRRHSGLSALSEY